MKVVKWVLLRGNFSANGSECFKVPCIKEEINGLKSDLAPSPSLLQETFDFLANNL